MYCKIISRYDKKNIMCGEIVFEKKTIYNDKLQNELISLDNSHFFHKNGNKNYYIILSNTKINYINNIKNYNLSSCQWTDVLNIKNIDSNIDIYIDNDINNVDRDINNLIYQLNSIAGIKTTGSCSGHNIKCSWVSMIISNFDTACKLFSCLQNINSNICNDWYIDFANRYSNTTLMDTSDLHCCLHATKIGYTCIDKLSILLENLIDQGFFIKKKYEKRHNDT